MMGQLLGGLPMIARLGGDVSNFVTPPVHEALKARFG